MAQAGGDGAIARVTKAGVVTEFPVPTPGDPTDIAVGPDGNLWYVDPTANVIGRITRDGSITEFTNGLDPAAEPTAITKGPDGKLWFTEKGTGRIGRISTGGTITEFTSGLSGSDEPADIATGPDGNLWFTLNADPGGIGRITPEGDVMKFSDNLTMNSRPLGIAAGPDGALWFTESAAPGRIGRITTEGDITEYSSGLLLITNPWFIAAGPDGNMWFTGNNLPGLVARITLPPLVRDVAADEIDTHSARLRGKVRPNSQATDYYFEYGPTADYGMDDQDRVRRQLVRPGLRLRQGRGPSSPTRSTTTAWWPRTTRGSASAPIVSSSRPRWNASSRCSPWTRSLSRWRTRSRSLSPTSARPSWPTATAPCATRRREATGRSSSRTQSFRWAWPWTRAEGKVNLRTAGCRGRVQAGVFGGGVFSVRQPREACGRVDVYLQGGSFAGCGRASRGAGSRTASASRSRKVRRLWGRDKGGRFRSHGRHSHATVRGTRWLTVDRCDGTLTRVTDGSVVVRDLRRGRNVLVRAGHSYFARAHRR